MSVLLFSFSCKRLIISVFMFVKHLYIYIFINIHTHSILRKAITGKIDIFDIENESSTWEKRQ